MRHACDIDASPSIFENRHSTLDNDIGGVSGSIRGATPSVPNPSKVDASLACSTGSSGPVRGATRSESIDIRNRCLAIVSRRRGFGLRSRSYPPGLFSRLAIEGRRDFGLHSRSYPAGAGVSLSWPVGVSGPARGATRLVRNLLGVRVPFEELPGLIGIRCALVSVARRGFEFRSRSTR
jgi:hypothetical protein